MSEFKELADYPSYRVSRDGRVISVTGWRGGKLRAMWPTLNADGYPSVRLTVGKGKRKRVTIHKLVAMAFLPPRPSPRHEIRHLDGDRLNSNAENLAWGTQAENAADRAAHGRTSHGKKHSEATKMAILASTNPYYRHARAAIAKALGEGQ